MGLNRAFNLSMELPTNSELNYTGIIDDLRNSCTSAECALQPDGSTDSAISWYDYQNDMKKFSKQYPDVVFCLNVIEECNTEFLDIYFKNGKMQVCAAEIVYPPYNENELK